jgi:hypothetical protein
MPETTQQAKRLFVIKYLSSEWVKSYNPTTAVENRTNRKYAATRFTHNEVAAFRAAKEIWWAKHRPWMRFDQYYKIQEVSE